MGLFEHFPYTNFHDLNLDEILKAMRKLTTICQELDSLVGGYEKRIRTLENFIKALESGTLPDVMMEAIYAWLDANVPEILSGAVQQVWFGLTDDGYFVANIPESWDDIVFNTTGWDIDLEIQPEYGHLVLSSRGTPVAYGG